MNCSDFVELREAAAIGALEPEDARRLAEHTAVCVSCRWEIERLSSVVELLALAAPQVEPPARLKHRILEIAAIEDKAPVQITSRRRLSRAWAIGKFGLMASAAALVLALGIGSWANGLISELQEQRRLNTALADELQNRDELVQLISSRAELLGLLNGTQEAPFARGRMYAASENNTALIIVDQLQPLPADRVYQVWLMHGGMREDAGTFTVDENGRGKWLIHATGNLSGYQAASVTEEPVGGSLKPTSPRLLIALFN